MTTEVAAFAAYVAGAADAAEWEFKPGDTFELRGQLRTVLEAKGDTILTAVPGEPNGALPAAWAAKHATNFARAA
ncbi:MAG: hypothetical protein ACLQVK_06700 [Acidimicrobiales bacterium]|jgi:hypothetical protein